MGSAIPSGDPEPGPGSAGKPHGALSTTAAGAQPGQIGASGA